VDRHIPFYDQIFLLAVMIEIPSVYWGAPHVLSVHLPGILGHDPRAAILPLGALRPH
jgi:hypothetical protein